MLASMTLALGFIKVGMKMEWSKDWSLTAATTAIEPSDSFDGGLSHRSSAAPALPLEDGRDSGGPPRPNFNFQESILLRLPCKVHVH